MIIRVTSRRAIICGLCAAALVPVRARAQTTAGVHRIGILTPAPQLFLDRAIEALAGHGWNVGRNLIIETRYTQGDPQRAEMLARQFVEQRVHLIVTHFTGTAMAARRATSVTPIVMATSGFPVEGGLASSLARPGGNVTGVAVYASGGALFGKYVQLLRELVPSLRELGVFWGYAPPTYKLEQVAPAIEGLQSAAAALNINVRFWQTGTEDDLATALKAAGSRPPDALFVTSGVIHPVPAIEAKISQFIAQRRLPTLSDGRVVTAALAAYYPETSELAARVAHFIDRVLKGAKPADLPIEHPTRYQLSVNLKMAKAIGVTVPSSLLVRADQVIE